MSRRLLACALFAATACTQTPAEYRITADRPVVHAPPSPDPFPSLPPPPTEPGKTLVLTQQVPLNAVTHGFDGSLDIYREIPDLDYLPMVGTVLQLVPRSGKPAHIALVNAHDPSAITLRFGDAAHESVLLEYDQRWATGAAHTQVVVGIEDGKPLLRPARHPVTGVLKPVEVWSSSSGVAVHAARVAIAPDGSAELLQVLCAEVSPKHTCTSLNRVFYVLGGKWWWNEREGTACIPKTDGGCAAKAAFAPRSEFPPVPPS